MRFLLPCLLLCALAACSPEYEHNEAALFDADWRNQYTKVIDCKQSPTHASNYVETWVSASALEAYRDRTKEFPKDAVVLKAQYSDAACSQEEAWTAMRRKADGPVTELEDWSWQRVEADGSLGFNPSGSGFCGDCHMGCDRGSFMCDVVE